MEYKFDSGAGITFIAETDHLETWDRPLQVPSTILRGSSSTPFIVIGKFCGQLRTNRDNISD